MSEKTAGDYLIDKDEWYLAKPTGPNKPTPQVPLSPQIMKRAWMPDEEYVKTKVYPTAEEWYYGKEKKAEPEPVPATFPDGCGDPECSCSPNNAPDVLDLAGKAVRRSGYKEPSEVYGICAKAWSAMLGVEIDAKKVCLLMAVFKISRELTSPKQDNLTDVAGYAWCAERCDKLDPRR